MLNKQLCMFFYSVYAIVCVTSEGERQITFIDPCGELGHTAVARSRGNMQMTIVWTFNYMQEIFSVFHFIYWIAPNLLGLLC